LGGELPEFLESIYKIDTGIDHVAKFRGDRPRELGDYALKKKKHHEHFMRPPVTTVPGGLNMTSGGSNFNDFPENQLTKVRAVETVLRI